MKRTYNTNELIETAIQFLQSNPHGSAKIHGLEFTAKDIIRELTQAKTDVNRLHISCSNSIARFEESQAGKKSPRDMNDRFYLEALTIATSCAANEVRTNDLGTEQIVTKELDERRSNLLKSF